MSNYPYTNLNSAVISPQSKHTRNSPDAHCGRRYEMFNYSYNKRDLFDAVNLPIAHVFLDANTPPGKRKYLLI